MATIYIDVYFLINFTVDLLAIYYSCLLSKIKCGIKRMIFAAAVGGSYAVLFVLFFENAYLMYPISLFILMVMIFTLTRGISFYRKIKYTVSFLIFQIMIGGIVYFGYCFLSEHISKEIINAGAGNNKKLLILALLVLFAMGVIKLVGAFFLNSKSEKMAVLEVRVGNKTGKIEALVDSGNLALDPFDKSPVMLIVLKEVRRFINIPDNIEAYDQLTADLKKKIRIIPISDGRKTRILYGIKADGIYYIKGNKKEELKLTIAIDTETRDYGGYFALLPLSALEDI